MTPQATDVTPRDDGMLAPMSTVLEDLTLTTVTGRLTRIAGKVLEAEMPRAAVGGLCRIETRSSEDLLAEVVGFNGEDAILAPLGDTLHVAQRAAVHTEPTPLSVPVGPSLLGRVLDGLGNPIDGLGPVEPEALYPVANVPADPMKRQSVTEPISTGVRAIDGVLTCGRGQRVGLFAGSGVGKSTLMGMITKNSDADVVVCGLIGERNREVRDFVLETLGEEGLKKSVVVAATSDQPPMVRVRGSFVATAIAEYFRDQGLNVVLLLDSVTRLAMAQREIGLSAGEPPTTRGYTPSVFAMMPQLMERAGMGVTGSITAFYTVLVDGDDMNEPVADAARGILDGHIVLTRALAHKGHYPAIDILQSVSRLRGDVTSEQHVDNAVELQRLCATYKEAEDLISVGAYVQGSNPDIDRAKGLMPQIDGFLRQRTHEHNSMQETSDMLASLVGGQAAPVASQSTANRPAPPAPAAAQQAPPAPVPPAAPPSPPADDGDSGGYLIG